ncbi:MAG: LacI family DNA-binding transcriptional regulator [Kiritimatiellia bacterium]|nr:LacI family DNA-binding transcriptional regulator [Kiritimatiellia bacterium]
MKPDRKPRKRVDSRPTRWMVAQKAGVSVATVTHALLETPGKRIGKETRDRVKRIARELEYTPNFMGRALQIGKTFTIGILQPSHRSVFSLYYQTILFGMVRAMEVDDYHLLVLFRSEAKSYLKAVERGRVDGMFILQSDRGTQHIESVLSTGIPTMVVNAHYENPRIRKLGTVHSDHEEMMRRVVKEFHGLGCKSIVQIHNHQAYDANFHMFNAFQQAAAELSQEGLSASSLLLQEEFFSSQIEHAFAARPKWDGVFVDGPSYAEFFVATGRKYGLEPNRDYYLISSSTVDGDLTPSRSEVSAYTHQAEKMGAAAWESMKRLICENSTPPVTRVPYRRIAAGHGEKTGEDSRSE